MMRKMPHWMRALVWKRPEIGAPGKRLKILTTNDLDDDGKLKKNHLEEREQRAAAAAEEEADSSWK